MSALAISLTIVTHLFCLSVIRFEVHLDKWFWKVFGPGSDKPWSTMIRTLLGAGVCVWAEIFDPFGKWWTCAIMFLCYYGYFFNPIINIVLKKDSCYTSDGSWDSIVGKIPCYWRAGLFAVLWTCSIFVYYII